MPSHAELLTSALARVPDNDPKAAKAARAFVMGLKGDKAAIKCGIAAERKASSKAAATGGGKAGKSGKASRRRTQVPESVLKYIEENIDGVDGVDPVPTAATTSAAPAAPTAAESTGDVNADIPVVITDYSWLQRSAAPAPAKPTASASA